MKREYKIGEPKEIKERYDYYFYKDGTYLETEGYILDNDHEEEKILHSINDKPALIWSDGDEAYYKNGKLHRENGPAVVFNNKINNSII